MMGIQPSARQPALFTFGIDLERRVPADHLLRQVDAVLDLSFVIPAVAEFYGRSGHVSLDPRLIVKLMLLLFLYDIPSERELMDQVRVRLDFLWFLGLDLDSPIPNHSVASKARARWGNPVFEQLFVRTVQQCVAAGLVNGRLLHIDSTTVKAHASKDSVVSSGPELVAALRRAYQSQAAKLEALAPEAPASESTAAAAPAPVPAGATPAAEPTSATPAEAETLRVLPRPAADPGAAAPAKKKKNKPQGPRLPVNATHISTTDPEAQLAQSKNGVTELNYKDHRMVDDAHGVITAVAATAATVADGAQLFRLYAQHRATTGLAQIEVTVAGDRHYGTAENYLDCAQAGLRAHLGEASAQLEARGHLPLSQFTYEPQADRLRCPQGHYLVLRQYRPEAQLKDYRIKDPPACAACPLRAKCTDSKHGRTIRRHVQSAVIEAGRAAAYSPAGRYSRKRRKHVMEGSFADAANNHGIKKARWRGLWRQQIQSWLIAALQNLRLLLRKGAGGPARAAAALARSRGKAGKGGLLSLLRAMGGLLRGWVPPSPLPSVRSAVTQRGA